MRGFFFVKNCFPRIIRCIYPFDMPNNFQHQVEQRMSALEHWMVPLFKKTPHLPHGAREFIVEIGPWLALIFGILGLFGLFGLWSIEFIEAFFSFHIFIGGASIAMIIGLVTGVIGCILQIIAFKPLRSRKKRGWNLLFYSLVLGAISALANVLLAFNAFGGVVGPLLGFWFLFEVRSFYK